MKTAARFVLVAAWLAALAGAGSAAVPMVGTVESITGDVWIKAHEADPPIRLKPGRTLSAGTVLRLAPAAIVLIKWTETGVTSSIDAPLTAERLEPLRHTGTPRTEALQKSVSELIAGGLVGGLNRNGNTTLYAPSNRARLVPGSPVTLRWAAGAHGRTVKITVVSDRGEPVWEAGFPAERGREVSSELGRAMLEAGTGGARFFSFRATVDGGETDPAEDVQCSLLPRAQIAPLEEELALCEETPAPWRHVLRAAVYRKRGVSEAALAELEQAMTDPVLGRQPELLFAAARLHEGTGNRTRAEALRRIAGAVNEL